MRSHGELGGELLRGISKSWIWFDSRTTSNQSCFPAVLQSNRAKIKFGTAEVRRLNWAVDSFWNWGFLEIGCSMALIRTNLFWLTKINILIYHKSFTIRIFLKNIVQKCGFILCISRRKFPFWEKNVPFSGFFSMLIKWHISAFECLPRFYTMLPPL